jgi:hypothetical protein
MDGKEGAGEETVAFRGREERGREVAEEDVMSVDAHEKGRRDVSSIMSLSSEWSE